MTSKINIEEIIDELKTFVPKKTRLELLDVLIRSTKKT